ncbi:MAG: hypothetical protein N3G78_08720 [Desulfobacterota bacterium]|nr:hypothetical protein [Thermodesulfobacteriota bacterium]
MEEGRFDFGNLKLYPKAFETSSALSVREADRLRTASPLDEILVRLTPEALLSTARRILFHGEGAGGIASYAAGWMAGRGMEVVVLDGANRFDPYLASSPARKASISPEELLRRIRIARAFTCYQMATLVGERLSAFLSEEGDDGEGKRPWVILLGPIATFLDEDVPEREAGHLFERTLRKVDGMAAEGIPFFLFQPPLPPGSRRLSLMRRLFQSSDLIWRIALEDEGPRMILEKKRGEERGRLSRSF